MLQRNINWLRQEKSDKGKNRQRKNGRKNQKNGWTKGEFQQIKNIMDFETEVTELKNIITDMKNMTEAFNRKWNERRKDQWTQRLGSGTQIRAKNNEKDEDSLRGSWENTSGPIFALQQSQKKIEKGAENI